MVRNTARLLERIKSLELAGKKNRKQIKSIEDRNKRLRDQNKSLTDRTTKLEAAKIEQSKNRSQILERGPSFTKNSK